MSTIRLLNNGNWSKPPVLTAARKVMMDGLAERCARKPLGELADVVNGTSYDVGLLRSSGTPIIRISNISDPLSAYLTTQERFADRFMVEPGDLLVSWSASFKSIIWPGPAGVLNQHIFKVTERPGCDRGYVRHAVEAAFDVMQQKVVGIGMMHLRRGDFLGHLVPAPDLETQRVVCRFLDWVELRNGPEPALPPKHAEQRRIVARIEELAGKVEEARGLRREAVIYTGRLLSTAANELLAPHADRWPLSQILAEPLLNGLSLPASRLGTGVVFARVGVVNSGLFDARQTKLADIALNDDSPYWLRTGDVLISRGNTPELVGRAAVYNGVPERCAMPDLLIRARPDYRLMNAHFLAMYFHTDAARNYIESQVTGTSPSMKKISQPKLLKMPVPRLPVAEQERILNALVRLQNKIEGLRCLQAESGAELDALLPSILDRAFSGSL